MKPLPLTIISRGQTGADRAALDWATGASIHNAAPRVHPSTSNASTTSSTKNAPQEFSLLRRAVPLIHQPETRHQKRSVTLGTVRAPLTSQSTNATGTSRQCGPGHTADLIIIAFPLVAETLLNSRAGEPTLPVDSTDS